MASTYIQRNNGTPDNRKKFTFSFWVKRAKLGTYQYIQGFQDNGVGDPRMTLTFRDDDVFELSEGNSSGTTLGRLRTSRKFRDTSAWYAITVAVDTTLATADDRIKIWVNGVQETAFDNRVNYTQNLDTCIDDNRHTIGAIYNNSLSGYFDGSLSHYHYCDGYAYQASNFGSTDSTTGEWQINTSPSVSYGTNGCFVLKDGNSVTDQSPNTNNFTAGGTLTKTEDSPSNVFCTNNSLWKQESTRYLTHTRGNTMISGGASATWYQTPGTLAFNSGKFYWECKWNAGTNLTQNHSGVIDYDKTMETGLFRAKTGSVFFTNEDGGETWIDGSNSSADYGTIAQNDILGVAVDMDATTPTVKFYKNGSLHLTANVSSLAGKFVTPAQMIYQSGEFQLNFGNGYFSTTAVSSAGTNASGNGIFEYDVPTGYTALSTKGLNL